MRAFHESKLTREPPAHNSPALPELPAPTVHGDRIAWPTVFQYRITDTEGQPFLADLPPTEKADRVPSRPDTSPAMRQPRTLPYEVVVHDLPRYERLKAEGLLQDPRHTGHDYAEMVDNRTAPGA